MLCLRLTTFGQPPAIDNSNYYNFQQADGRLNWLRSSDVIPIIIDELLKNGIAYHTISVGDLMKVNDSTQFVLTVAFDKNDKEFGFVFDPIHSIPLNVKDRLFLTDRKKAFYLQSEKDLDDNLTFMKVFPLPNNVFLLKQTCYWFQYDEKGTAFPVSKEMAQNILRQDIDQYLKSI